MNYKTLSLSLPVLLLFSGCSGGSSKEPVVKPARYTADIRRTSFGIPHIKGNSEGDVGFGVGYAYAEDNLCALADEVVTVNGERSRYFGPDGSRAGYSSTNLETDYFYRLINDEASLRQSWEAQPEEIRQLVLGYVAGYNQYLQQTGMANLPGDCKGGAWVRALNERDLLRLMRRYAVEGSSGQFVPAVVSATPPGAPPAAMRKASGMEPNVLSAEYWRRLHSKTGSNAVAFGKDLTDNGHGMLLGNSHFPWKGSLRFYQLHLTIPGKMDVMGASLAGLPLVNMGFNQNLAWSHTVNTSSHFTLHRLQLDAKDPTRYVIDGQSKQMNKRTVTVDVRQPDGTLKSQSRDFYGTEFGMLVVVPGVAAWDRSNAYALGDANLNNHRLIVQWYAMGRAATLADFRKSIESVLGLPWVNTLAADKDGQALFTAATAVPNVSPARQAACVAADDQALASQGFFILDGSRAACAWGVEKDVPQVGIFAAASLPALMRSDYVQNSNDSAWLTNPAAPLTGYPNIVSRQDYEQSGRTRLGISQLRLNGERMSLAKLQQMVLNNRVYIAEQVMDDLLRICSGPACTRLSAWDRTANLNANMGYVYFTGMWDRLRGQPVWKVPFNPADPVNTPRGLNVDDPDVAAAVRMALAQAVNDAEAKGWTMDKKWGDIQVAVRGAKKIPIHGGDDIYGVYNAITSTDIGGGLRDVTDGTSYLQAVTFDKNGPVAQAILSYSQSSQSSSPYYADQTERFSNKAWIAQPYTEAQITADPNYQTRRITLP